MQHPSPLLTLSSLKLNVVNERTDSNSKFEEDSPPQSAETLVSSQQGRTTEPESSSDINILECKFCLKPFSHSGHFNEHLRTHSGIKPYICKFCEKTFSQSGHLTIHLRTHTGERPFVCSYCQKAFTQSGTLSAHLRIHTEEKPYECPYCLKLFSRTSYLVTHLRVHTEEKPFECKFCKKRFSQSGHLTGHLKIHTGEKPYTCDFCQKSFSLSGNLTKHLRIHTGERPYECDFCQKSFSQSNSLVVHLRIHTGEKPFECRYCFKTFSRANYLSTHMTVHTREKHYECKHCKKAFAQASHLKEHIKVHTGERPYACSVCKKTFAQSGNLTKHMRVHSGERPYQCPYCPEEKKKCFSQSYSLTTHLRQQHGAVVDVSVGIVDLADPDKTREQKNSVRNEHASNCNDDCGGSRNYMGGTMRLFKCKFCEEEFTRSAYLWTHVKAHVNGLINNDTTPTAPSSPKSNVALDCSRNLDEPNTNNLALMTPTSSALDRGELGTALMTMAGMMTGSFGGLTASISTTTSDVNNDHVHMKVDDTLDSVVGNADGDTNEEKMYTKEKLMAVMELAPTEKGDNNDSETELTS